MAATNGERNIQIKLTFPARLVIIGTSLMIAGLFIAIMIPDCPPCKPGDVNLIEVCLGIIAIASILGACACYIRLIIHWLDSD
jgi:hypothetical protein